MTCRGFVRRTGMLATVLIVALLSACGPRAFAVWDGSGEYGEANFFKFRIDLDSDVPVAMYETGGNEVQLAVCDLTVKEKHVEFKMDPTAAAQTCDKMQEPQLFIGDFGQDVLTGQVLDSSGRLVGVFRAFRVVN